MAGKYEKLSKTELIKRLRGIEQELRAQMDTQEFLQDLHIHQEEIRVQNQQLLDMKRSLEQSRDRFIDLYDFAPIAYITLDANGVVLDINLRGTSLLVTERLPVLGSPFNCFVEESDQPAFLDHMRRCREKAKNGGQGVISEIRIKARDGREFIAQLFSRPAPAESENGTPSFRTAVTDMTEWKKTEEEKRELAMKEQNARAAAEAKDRFMAILSHELRTPLTPVLAAVSALLARSNVSRSDRPILEMIRRNIELEARLIEDLLDLTRITRNKLQLRVENVDMHAAIRDVLEMCAEEAHAKALKVSSELRARKPMVRGDPARLRQIVWNLLKNAIKFTPAGGLVVIRTSNPSGNRLALQVSDTGIGIQPALLGKLFSAFEQDEIDRRRYGGLGLGLTISKALVESHDGTISASSEGKGRGATFTVDLPAAAVESATAPQAAPAKPDGKPQKLRILLVEDHSDTAQILARLLENEGHQVKIATNVGDALKLSGDGFMDLIISDLGLPDGSGYELIQQVRPQLPKAVPAIALSGYGAESDIRRSLESGFAEHITKPVDFGRLLRAIDQVISA